MSGVSVVCHADVISEVIVKIAGLEVTSGAGNPFEEE